MLKRSSMFGAWLRIQVSTSAAMSMISSMLLPWLNWRNCDEVPITTSSPFTPVSNATAASSLWQRMWVRMRAFSFSATMVRTSSAQPGDASGDVSSRYSTPNSSSACATRIFCSRVKSALINCSPSRRVESIMA